METMGVWTVVNNGGMARIGHLAICGVGLGFKLLFEKTEEVYT